MALSTHVADRENLGPCGLGGLRRKERVDRLARLADRDYEVVRKEDRLAVAHLARELDHGRYPGDLLDPDTGRPWPRGGSCRRLPSTHAPAFAPARR